MKTSPHYPFALGKKMFKRFVTFSVLVSLPVLLTYVGYLLMIGDLQITQFKELGRLVLKILGFAAAYMAFGFLLAAFLLWIKDRKK